jgi:hypothetical protein
MIALLTGPLAMIGIAVLCWWLGRVMPGRRG